MLTGVRGWGGRTGTRDLTVEGRGGKLAERFEVWRWGVRDQTVIALHIGAGRLTREVLGEGRGARERAEGRLGVEVERVPDAHRGLWVDRLRRHGVGAVAGTRSRDCRGGEGGEGGGEEGEELHDVEDGVDDVGWGEVVGLSSGDA